MKPHVLQRALWTVAFALVFYWLISYAAISLVNAEHNPTVYHYKYKVCPTPAYTGTR